MAADETALGALHTKVAEVLNLALEGEELPGYTDEETGEVFPAKRLAPSAAIIAAATKFLKDNNITCAPSQDNALGELEAKMRERDAKRANKLDLAQAQKDMASTQGFLSVLPN